MPDKIVVYARQRTGSTWLQRLLDRNVPGAEVDRDHTFPLKDADAYFVLMRDPWAWLTSFYNFQLHPIWGFVDQVWNRVLHPPVDIWRAFRWWDMYLLSYELWDRELPEDRTAWLKYEDLLPDPTEALLEAADGIGVDLGDEVDHDRSYEKDFSNPLSKIFSPDVLPSSSFDPTYYTEKRYLSDYRDSHQRALYEMAVSRGIADRFEAFGYDMGEDVPSA